MVDVLSTKAVSMRGCSKAAGKTYTCYLLTPEAVFQSSRRRNSFGCSSAFWIWIMKGPLLGMTPAGKGFEKWGCPTSSPEGQEGARRGKRGRKAIRNCYGYDHVPHQYFPFEMLGCSFYCLCFSSALFSLFTALFRAAVVVCLFSDMPGNSFSGRHGECPEALCVDGLVSSGPETISRWSVSVCLWRAGRFYTGRYQMPGSSWKLVRLLRR